MGFVELLEKLKHWSSRLQMWFRSSVITSVWNVLFIGYMQTNCSRMYLAVTGTASFLEMDKLSSYIQNWNRLPFIIIVLISKSKSFLSWNACLFLGYNIPNVQKRKTVMCSLQAMLIQAGL